MALWDKLRGELIDIIEWLDDSRNTLAYRFQRYDNEIKNGAKLVVREGQAAVFVNEGKLADVFGPGTYTLTTQNLPILSTLKGWKYGFESPFKAEVYFVSTRAFTDQKWGTRNPITLRDSDFGIVRIRAFGNSAYRCTEPATLVRALVGTDGRFTIEELGDQLRDLTVARFTDALGEAKVAAIDLAGHQDEIATLIRGRMKDDFAAFGLELVSFTIENVSMPPEVEAAIDKRSSMGAIGNLQAYQQYQTAQAIEAAANNPNGGLASLGANLSAGMAVGGAMANAMNPANAAAPVQSGPPPLPGAFSYYAALNGTQAGPFDAATLKAKIASGEISRETLVWKQGMASWAAAQGTAELAPLFASMPPPLPPR